MPRIVPPFIGQLHSIRPTSSNITHNKQSLRLLSGTSGAEERKQEKSRWRRLMRRWVPIPTTVGVTVLAILQWRRLQRARSHDPAEAVANPWKVTCYRAIPCRVLSRVWGWLSSRHIPGPLRSWVYGSYSSMYGVNLEEMAGDLTDYPSLAQFFTRELKKGVRPIDSANCIVSPADGTLVNHGKISSCNVEQIKGVTYKIQTFLGEPTWWSKETISLSEIHNSNASFIQEVQKSKTTDENSNEVSNIAQSDVSSKIVPEFLGKLGIVKYFVKRNQEQESCEPEDWNLYRTKLLKNSRNELYQAVVYLAPGDYHRFHSPINWKVNFRRHFQGELLSVNPSIASWIPELFSLNERVVYVGEWEHGFFSMTAVGATNVGSINVYCDKTLQTNSRKWRDGSRHKDNTMNVEWTKGEEVGEFRMGSTIVLIFEAPKDYVFNIEHNEKVKVGQSISCAITPFTAKGKRPS